MAHGSSLYVSLCTGAGGMASVRARSRSEARGAARGWGPTGEAQEAISLRCGSFDISEWTGDRRARGVIFEMPIPISLQASRFRPRRTIRCPVTGHRSGRDDRSISISTRQVRAATQKLTIELNCHGVK